MRGALVLGASLAACHPNHLIGTQTDPDAAPDSASADSSDGSDDSAMPMSGSAGCAAGTFCWSHPLPQGISLNGIWGSSPTDAWAVGELGAIVHWDGTAWRPIASGVTAPLRAVWGAAANDVWAVGDKALVHWDGSSWSSTPLTISLRALWGSSSTDVWAFGANSTAGSGAKILHWDGSTWNDIAPAGTAQYGFTDAWGAAANDIWATTYDAIWHYDGTAWSTSVLGGGVYYAIWGAGSSDIWAVGQTVNHWDGTSWTASTQTFYSPQFTSVWGSAGNDVWVGAGIKRMHWDGSAWGPLVTVDTPELLVRRAWGASASDAWAIGDGGRIEHYDGIAWADVDAPRHIIERMWANGPDDLWAVGGWGQTGDAMHWDGTRWSGMQQVAANDLRGVWGSAKDDIWAVGELGVAMRWNGSAWTQYPGTSNLHAVWGLNANDVWGVGYSSEIKHWDGTAWTLDPRCPTQPQAYGCSSSIGYGVTLADIWGSNDDDIWVVGGGVLVHRDATKWSVVDNGYDWSLIAVWGTASNDVWAVGWYLDRSAEPYTGHSLIKHFDGTTWTRLPVDTSVPLRGVGGTSSSDVWIAGDGGLLLHWDGSMLGTWDSGTINDLYAVRATTDGVYVSGSVGSVMFRAN